MKKPRNIAALACLFVLFSMFQCWEWFQRHPAGWKPHWWQSEVLAWIGLPFCDLAGVVASSVLELFHAPAPIALRMAFLLIAWLLLLVAVYKVVYVLARSLLKD